VRQKGNNEGRGNFGNIMKILAKSQEPRRRFRRGCATRATVMKENFGIKSFYPKIGGHVLTPKFGSRRKDPEV
jgi:hypothetical protein